VASSPFLFAAEHIFSRLCLPSPCLPSLVQRNAALTTLSFLFFDDLLAASRLICSRCRTFPETGPFCTLGTARNFPCHLRGLVFNFRDAGPPNYSLSDSCRFCPGFSAESATRIYRRYVSDPTSGDASPFCLPGSASSLLLP